MRQTQSEIISKQNFTSRAFVPGGMMENLAPVLQIYHRCHHYFQKEYHHDIVKIKLTGQMLMEFLLIVLLQTAIISLNSNNITGHLWLLRMDSFLHWKTHDYFEL